MSRPGDADRLLRWYPAPWRARYGDELAALVEDELAGGRPGLRLRLSLAHGGLLERARGAAVVGDSRPADERVRAGALLVLVAWAAADLAGGAFAKTSEHFGASGTSAALGPARTAHAVVVACGIAGGLVLLTGALVALGAVPGFTRVGGWRAVRGPLVRAAVMTALTAGAVVPLSVWAHHLGVAQRNGADLAYGLAFLAWAAMVAATVGLWAAAVVSVARRLELGPRALAVEAVLALVGAAALAVLTAAVGTWWVAMASAAPWYLGAGRPGTHPAPVSPQLVAIVVVLVVATVTAAFGASRIIRSRGALLAA